MRTTEHLHPPADGTGNVPNLPRRWKLVRRIGTGGQAEVWLATDTQLDQPVAIKCYSKIYTVEARSRWQRELTLGRSLQHPHLVRIHELIEAEDSFALAMEYLPGGSLSDRLDKDGPLSPAEVEEVALHILEALAYLHESEIAHRDVKPSNLMLDAGGNLRLADLGVAKYLNPSPDATQTIQAPGSPAYMSPEQLQNGEVGPASDLYSLGITLYELLTEKLPYEGRSTYEIATGHLRGALPDPKRIRPECSRWLARFIRRLMEKRPEDRFPSAASALRALETHRGLLSRRLYKRMALNAITVVLMAATALIGFLAWHHPTAPDHSAIRTTYSGKKLQGLDARGEVLWTVTTLAAIQQVKRADLFGDGKSETVLVSYRPSETQNLDRSNSAHIRPQVLVVGADGTVLSEFDPEKAVHDMGHIVSPPLLIPSAKVVDLLGDGKQQILVNARHRSLGTAYLWIYWPQRNEWDEILDHWGGWLYSIEPYREGQTPHLRILAFNGLLAAQPAEFDLVVRPPWVGSSMMFAGKLLPGAQPSEYSQFNWYTPLSPSIYNHRDPSKGFTVDVDGNSTFESNGRNITIDRWGNPVPGPNAGKNLAAQRGNFLASLYQLYFRAPDLGVSVVQQRTASMRSSFADLLREKPERTAFVQICARAFARAGDPAAGARLLERALQKDGFNDSLTLNLGEELAIQGNLHEARRILEHGYLDQQTPAGDWLCTKALARIAIETKDVRLLKKEELILSNVGYSSSVEQVMAARARLWWGQPLHADTRLTSNDLAPEGEAIACLARWCLHQITAGDIAAMTDSLKRNPDAAGECLIARAMAELSLKHPNRAVSDCLEAELRLSEKSTCEYWAYQTMQLARACHATALLAAGRRSEAVAMAKALLPKLRPGLLPYVLTQNVLTDSTTAAR